MNTARHHPSPQQRGSGWKRVLAKGWNSAGYTPPWSVSLFFLAVAIVVIVDYFIANPVFDGSAIYAAGSVVILCMSLPVATRYRFPALACFLIGGTGYVLAQDRVGFLVIIAIILVGILGAYSTFLLLMVYVGLIMAWAVWVSHQVYEDLSFVFPLALFALPIAAVGHLLNRARTRLLVTRKANEELELRQAEIRELERQSLARDLHDVVAHQLTVISLVSGSRLRSDDTEKLRTALKEVNGTSREALVELRTLLKVLRGAEDDPVLFGSPRNPLSNLGLQDGVEQLGTTLRKLGFQVHVSLEGGSSADIRASTVESVLKILQEACTNIVKHAEPKSHVRIRVHVGHEEASMTVESQVADTPRASSSDAVLSSSHGVIGMKERADLLGGSAHIGQTDNTWTARVSIPL